MGTEYLLNPVDKRKILRRLELEAYASVVTAFRAQGPLTENKQLALELLCHHFSISPGRHRAEVRRAVSDDLLSSIAESSEWERQWRKEGQRLAPSNTSFTSRPNTHQSQVLTSTTLVTHLPKPHPKSASTRPKEEPEKPPEKKAPSQRIQNVLKYIIAQNPNSPLAKAKAQTPSQSAPLAKAKAQTSTSSAKPPRKVQSAPATPVKKPIVEKKLAPSQISSQLAKALSPLKALVMGKTQPPAKPKEAESKTSGGKAEGLACSDLLEISPDKGKLPPQTSKRSVVGSGTASKGSSSEGELCKGEAMDTSEQLSKGKGEASVEHKPSSTTVVKAPSTVSNSAPSTSAVSVPSTIAVSTPIVTAVSAPLTSAVSAPSTNAVSAPLTTAISAPSTTAASAPSTNVVSAPSTSVFSAPSTNVVSAPSTTAVSTTSTIALSAPSTTVVSAPSTTISAPSTTAINTPSSIGVSAPSTIGISTSSTSGVSASSTINTAPSTAVVTAPSTIICAPSTVAVKSPSMTAPSINPASTPSTAGSNAPSTSTSSTASSNAPSTSTPSTAGSNIPSTSTFSTAGSNAPSTSIPSTAISKSVTPRGGEGRKRPAPATPPSPIKKQALSEDTKTTAQVKTTPPPLLRANDLLSPLTPDLPTPMKFGHSLTMEAPAVDTDKLLLTLSTDSYTREESELASELGVDPSLLDICEFMEIIHPEGVSIPNTPTTPLVFDSAPLVTPTSQPLLTVGEPPAITPSIPTSPVTTLLSGPLSPQSSVAMDTRSAPPNPPVPVEQATIRARPLALDLEQDHTHSTPKPSDLPISSLTGTALKEGISTEEIVQLTPKDLDLLREMGLGGETLGMSGIEDNLLEGIPQDLAATIQAIARNEEGDSVPWKQ